VREGIEVVVKDMFGTYLSRRHLSAQMDIG
jgi:hypothetical protein